MRRALAARIPETIDAIHDLINDAEAESRRRLILLTGVPGAGKTLVGLRVVYERSEGDPMSTFLSGNGPLVTVLQHALQSKVFVRDLHKFITSYGLTTRIPEQHVLVFDEAQRAWDAAYMEFKKRGTLSEPDLLVRIGGRLPEWAALVGLVGEGQEIYSGEEAGITQWRTALEQDGVGDWQIYCPPALAASFKGLDVETRARPRAPSSVALPSGGRP